ncbi:hypothetical protein GCM10023330_11440 [Litoribaculum gwangyangense]|uniref:Uncharacterized protein n=1 Tax=Litoribaculum gwangyangense TaxID=1130722 RepID=A0ABP9CBH0_9FLAO
MSEIIMSKSVEVCFLFSTDFLDELQETMSVISNNVSKISLFICLKYKSRGSEKVLNPFYRFPQFCFIAMFLYNVRT